MLGFASGLYVGTFNHKTCRPCLERVSDCFKKEFDRMTESYNKDDKDDKNDKDDKKSD
jgi:hypothetical protein|tara:strand:+ start:102 stop:275 length:174 start_codon:yes stop_codon:yes gene_type:complete